MLKTTSLIFALLLCICASAYAQDSTEPALIPLWPDNADATLQLYQPPADKASKAAIIVCPGGGYAHLAKHEGHDVAQWFQSIGITAIVLKYRRGTQYGHPVPLNDAQRAIRTARANASKWQIDPARIGIMGFSAGGHLAASASTHFDDGNSTATDPPPSPEKFSSRPDFSILGYPVITMTLPFTHKGSRKNLLGDTPSDALVDLMSNEKQVTAKTPPTFIFHSVDDKVVPLENTLLYVEALRKANVPFEFHVYETGNHGYGLAKNNPKINTWPTLLENWLRSRGFLK